MMNKSTAIEPPSIEYCSPPPAISNFSHLKPSDSIGAIYVLGCLAFTCLAIYFSTSQHVLIWGASQIALAVALLQWFALIHEAGHKTLFKSVRWNKYSGHLASVFSGIPFECWKAIHAKHHHWTGWQDLDATTATLVPRALARWERLVINVCWKFWVPVFSITYRVQNYWNLPRLMRLFPRRPKQRKLAWNLFVLLGVYGGITYLVGIWMLVQIFGLAVFLTLIMQDVLILSQHTHVPMELSHGENVDPFAPSEQEIFTRSLKFPNWFATSVLLNMDAHELHHIYTSVPGYFLQHIDYETHNEVCWWRWALKARQVPGEIFLFQNSHHSGFDI